MIEVGEGGADWTVEETDTMTQQRENPSHSRGANREDIFFPSWRRSPFVRDWLIGCAR